jgi:hypothetical protein
MSLTHLLNTLENNPGAVVAWEVDKVRDVPLSVFRVDGGTAQLAHLVVDAANRAAVVAELETRGVVAGAYASMTGLVWQKHNGRFMVWGPRGRIFDTDGKTLNFQRHTDAMAPGVEVIAFVDADFVDRGVRIVVGGASHIVAKHSQIRASIDMSYGALDALADSGWVLFLGRELADFIGAPLVDQTA